MRQLATETAAAVSEWVREFNAGRYFEAHEVLEAPWLRASEPEKTFLKGLIHAAVALHHRQRGNAHGTRTKHASAVRYLSPYRPAFGGVDVEGLLAEVERYLAAPSEQRPQVRLHEGEGATILADAPGRSPAP
jgi:predicted metal-dependent hydrolase